MKVAKQQISGYTRFEGKKKIVVPRYFRKTRGSPGSKRIIGKTIKFRPKRPIRDKFGQLRGFK